MAKRFIEETEFKNDLDDVDDDGFELSYFQAYVNLVLLALAWAWTLTVSTLLTSIAPLSASKLGVSDTYASFTIGIFLVGAALSSVPR